MIIFDTETTGLITNSVIPGSRQPRIIQLFCLKLDDDNFAEIDSFNAPLINPCVPIEPEATKVHGVTDEMVKAKDVPTFEALYKPLAKFFLGEKELVAHNLAFDRDVLYYELLRLNKSLQFPWPPNHVCTVEQTEHIRGYRLKLGDLYEYLFNEKFADAHNAEADVRALARCYIELVEAKGFIKRK